VAHFPNTRFVDSVLSTYKFRILSKRISISNKRNFSIKVASRHDASQELSSLSIIPQRHRNNSPKIKPKGYRTASDSLS
jgi:hypothetical protein